jgi:putative tryptophan/tyrosine transport system substrate-binding protein
MNRKRLKWVLVALVAMMNLLSGEARAEKKIGVLMFSDEARYSEAAKGVLEQLGESGFKEPEVRFTMENAGGSKAKAAELVQKFAAAKLDLIVAIGTTAAIAVTREIKDVPVVFSMVYDPVEAKIAQDWKSSGNNTTGTSPRFPMSKLMDRVKEFAPVKRLAVLYTPGEKNSETQLKDLQEIQANYKLRVIPVPLTKKGDVIQILPEVIATVDAIFITGSNVVDNEIAIIIEMASRAKVITVTHLEDLVEKGVLLGVCSNPYLGGQLAGKKAVKILKGARPAAIPIEPLKRLELIINMRTAKAGQYRIPPSFMKSVTKVVR